MKISNKVKRVGILAAGLLIGAVMYGYSYPADIVTFGILALIILGLGILVL